MIYPDPFVFWRIDCVTCGAVVFVPKGADHPPDTCPACQGTIQRDGGTVAHPQNEPARRAA